jgi:hypothetical protein
MNVEISPTPLLTVSSLGLNDSIVAPAALFDTRSGSELPTFNAKDLPLISYFSRTVLVTAWPSVMLMNPRGRTEDTNRPSLPNDIDSFAPAT